ncbi:MAG: HEAT repeat domain-containing protein [Planctomycetota bacterium]
MALLALAGCTSAGLALQERMAFAPAADERPDPIRTADAADDKVADAEPDADVAGLLRAGRWVEPTEGDAAAWRWVPQEDPDADPGRLTDAVLREAAEESEPRVAATAVLLLEGRGVELGRADADTLVAAVGLGRGESVPTVSLAAAAALPRALMASAGPDADPSTTLTTVAGLSGDDTLDAAVRGELMVAMSAHIAPGRIATLDDFWAADREPTDVELRRAGLDACLAWADQRPELPFHAAEWPLSLEQARYDTDPGVRNAFVRWAAAAGHPDVAAIATRMLSDPSSEVRIAACRTIASAETRDAANRLEEIASTDAPEVAAAAITALAGKDPETLVDLADRDRHETRVAVASALSEVTPTPSAVAAAGRLVGDRRPDVQQATLRGVRDWPADALRPVLIEAVAVGTLRTRRSALSSLRRLTGDAAPFPIDEDVATRAAALQERGWIRTASWEGGDRTPVDEDERRRWIDAAESILAAESSPHDRRSALATLAEAGPAGRDAVDAWAATHRDPAGVVSEVLTPLDPRYAVVDDFAAGDVRVRRRAAHAVGETLSPGLLAVLIERLPTEQDAEVWRALFDAAASSRERLADEQIARLVEIGVGHQWGDIRVLTARFAGGLAEPRLGPKLLPLFADGSADVRLASVEAAGACGHPLTLNGRDDKPGLTSLFEDPDRRVATAAVTEAAELGDATAWDRLTAAAAGRPAAGMDRVEAFAAIGRSGRTEGFEFLVATAWASHDEDVRGAALAALSTLAETTRSGPADVRQNPPTLAEWAAWCERRRDRSKLHPSDRDGSLADAGPNGPPR